MTSRIKSLWPPGRIQRIQQMGRLHQIRKAGMSACLVVLMGGSSACIEIQSSPLDTSQGGIFGFLSLVIRGTEGNTLVAVGANNLAYTSSDAQTWQQNAIVSGVNYTFHDVIWTGTRFIAVGGDASACAIFLSDDGFNWSPATMPTCPVALFAVAASTTDSQRIVTVGDVNGPTPMALTSADGGLTWSVLVTAGVIRYTRLVFANNEFMALDDPLNSSDGAAYTSDGTSTFALVNTPVTGAGKGTTLGDAIAVGNRIIRAGTDPGTFPPAPMATTTTTDNGASAWTVNATTIYGGSNSLIPRALAVSTAGRLVALGDSCAVDATSDLANLTWSGVQTTVTGCSGVNWMDLIYDGSRFLAVGNNGSNQGFAALSATGDAASWTQSSIGSTLIYSLAIKP
ncbi:MAG: hypothetical protein NXI24_21145 [bacterium]|nr:hypothetical protein [bacterium]